MGCLSLPVSAETTEFTIPEDAIDGGIVEKDYGQFIWVIDKDGKLTVNGTGNLAASPGNSMPWHWNYEEIKAAEINMTGMTFATGMFKFCENLETVDLSGLDTSTITDMSEMFKQCYSLESLDLSGFDTSNVTDMSWMFSSCRLLGSVDVSNFDTDKVTKMESMFMNCKKLRSLNLHSFNIKGSKTSGLKGGWLTGCESLEEVITPLSDTNVALPGTFLMEDGTEVTKLPGKKGILLKRELAITPTPTVEESPTPSVTEMPEPTVTEVPEPTVSITSVFSDVHKDWYTDYIQYVFEHQLMTGIKGTDRFEPNANITKAQVAQVLYNMSGEQAEDKSVFGILSDVYPGEWYANAVAWAYSSGVVTGDLNTKKFNPNAYVTREQLAIMLYRYAVYDKQDVSATSDFEGLKNAENISNWALDGVRWTVGSGLISGIEKNGVKDLAPQGNATRAQMAAILQRFCEK